MHLKASIVKSFEEFFYFKVELQTSHSNSQITVHQGLFIWSWLKECNSISMLKFFS